MGSFNDYLASLKNTEQYTQAKAQDCVINAILEQMRLQNVTEKDLVEKALIQEHLVRQILADEISLFDWGLIRIAHALNCDLKIELVPKEREGENSGQHDDL